MPGERQKLICTFFIPLLLLTVPASVEDVADMASRMIGASWPPSLPASDPAAVAARKWASDARQSCGKASGYGERKTFATYADGSETPEQIFGSNLERLREVKRKWDPENKFRWAGRL
jgi:hypothetical protein